MILKTTSDHSVVLSKLPKVLLITKKIILMISKVDLVYHNKNFQQINKIK